MEALIKVVQTDLAHPMLIIICSMMLGTFMEMACVIALVHVIGVTALLTFAHIKDNAKLVKVGKIANVGLTLLDFFCIFVTSTKL